ncbi:protein of unknown function [Lactiplantibacillus plantarum]
MQTAGLLQYSAKSLTFLSKLPLINPTKFQNEPRYDSYC